MCCPLSPLLERSDRGCGEWDAARLGPSSPNPYQGGRDLWLRPSAGDNSHGSETFNTVDRPFRCYKPQWEWEYGWSAAARLLAGVATGPSHWPGRLTSAVTNSWLAAYITSSEL